MNFKVNETKQKLRGAYYTPAHIATFLARWVLEIEPKSVLEPSCGDGAFFAALKTSGARTSTQLFGCELAPEEASKAIALAQDLGFKAASVAATDFIGWAAAAITENRVFDAAIGNPPFVRYQYIGEETQSRMERLFSELDVPFTRHTNLWVPFILASLALLRDGGRLAFVVPAELLHVLHALGLRDYLARQCSDIVIVDPTDIWFGETLQGVVLLMAEKKAQQVKPATIEIVSLARQEQLGTHLEQLRDRRNSVSVAGLGPKWVSALMTPSERDALHEIRANPKIREFHDIAEAEVGIVTGANDYFFVTEDVVAKYRLEPWVKPMMGRSEHVDGVIYDAAQHDRNRAKGYPTCFLDFEPPLLSRIPTPIRNYVKLGEDQKLHKRYKCRIREPWYVVPSVYVSPVGLLKRSHHFPRLFLNNLGALTTDTAYRVKPLRTSAISLVGSFLNSLTALTAELEGRHYGGGVLELVPSEIERLLVPLAEFTMNELRQVDKAVEEMAEPEEFLEHRDLQLCKKLHLNKKLLETVRRAYQQLRLRRMRLPLPESTEEE